MKYSFAFSALALVCGAAAQQPLWGQCGGIGWTGGSNCVAGAFCSTLNPYYAQCLSGSNQPTTTPATTPRTTAPATTTARTTTPATTPRTTTPSTTPRTSTTTARTTTPATTPRTTTPATTRTTTRATGVVGNPVTITGNPFAGRKQHYNQYYSSEIYNIAVPSLVAAGKASLTAAAKAVATVPTFVWFDTISKLAQLEGHLNDIRAKRATGEDTLGIFVVYDLPDRDCAAKASNGELSIANNGVNIYKTQYIDPMVEIFKRYPDIPLALIIEPDSVANMITNLGVQKCAGAQAAYEECISYAVQKLNLPNIAMYLDAGHAGWLGWPDNLSKSGPYYANLYKKAGSPASFRGLATNVANYNAWSISSCPSYTSPNANCDEKRYINQFGPLLRQNGWDAHFVVDQGRSGKQPTGQLEWGHWCNAVGTGFGIRPDTPTNDPLVDAFVWIKPGGECDGTSDTTAVRYDSFCGSASSLKPAPEAGEWFQAYFEQLLVNANPSFM